MNAFVAKSHSLPLLTGIESDLVCYALLVNALFILHRFQGPYNGGSDLLGYLILVCLCLAHAAPDPVWRDYALAYLALQPILSYFKSGWSKAIHRDWWSGQALRDVFDYSAYPVSDAVRARFRDSALLAPMSWAVILFELAFPLALLHRDALVAALAVAAAFHLANFLLFNDAAQAWEDGTWMKQTKYHALFGVKFLLALGVFYFASGLVGRGEGTAWIRANRGKWLSVTLLMAVAIVMLSGWMRGLHVGPNRVAEEEASGVRFNVTQEGMAAGEDESNSAAPAEEAAGDGAEEKAEDASAEDPAAAEATDEAAEAAAAS